ncbi:MAG: hypothetical protein H0U18_03860 [Pyrinomonadaceae bacterium]|nr:hypothetical protein [Pyrinomonadaceae bacterium]
MKAKAGLILIVAVAIFAVVSLWALPSVKMQTGQSGQDNRRDDNDDDGDRADACRRTRGPAVRLPTTKLFIEHNSTAEDTGVHGAFDSIDWQKLCVFDPNGRLVLEVEPKRQLRDLSISGIFFESREPPNEEVPIEEILVDFPKDYTLLEAAR